jgi:hypothetical protein
LFCPTFRYSRFGHQPNAADKTLSTAMRPRVNGVRRHSIVVGGDLTISWPS